MGSWPQLLDIQYIGPTGLCWLEPNEQLHHRHIGEICSEGLQWLIMARPLFVLSAPPPCQNVWGLRGPNIFTNSISLLQLFDQVTQNWSVITTRHYTYPIEGVELGGCCWYVPSMGAFLGTLLLSCIYLLFHRLYNKSVSLFSIWLCWTELGDHEIRQIFSVKGVQQIQHATKES